MNNISHVTINSVCSGENPGEKGEKLKQPKKPTRAQKEILSKNKLKPEKLDDARRRQISDSIYQ